MTRPATGLGDPATGDPPAGPGAPDAPALGRQGGQGGQGGEEGQEQGNRGALVKLAAALAVIVALALLAHGGTVLLVILALVLMIMLHELGHFATAKWSGMKVTEYFLGFGPRLWSVRRGETEYGVKALPAGGYVRIVGMTTAEEVEPPDETRTYRQASFPRRLAVGVAGSTMHFVMAFLLLFGLFIFVGTPVVTGTEVGGLYSFATGSTPAQRAGLRAGDVFVSVDGHAPGSASQLESFIEAHTGRSITLVVRRDGHLVTLHVTPVDGRTVTVQGATKPVRSANGPAEGVIGVELESVAHDQPLGFFSSVGQAGGTLGSVTAATAVEIGQVFSPHGLSEIAHDVAQGSSNKSSANQQAESDRPVSIVGVVQIASQAAQQDVGELLLILAAVNIFIGMVNMFPMLPLDGGHVVIAIYERIRSRRGRRYFADVQKMMPVAYLVLAFLVVFGLSALYLDIVSPVHLPGG